MSKKHIAVLALLISSAFSVAASAEDEKAVWQSHSDRMFSITGEPVSLLTGALYAEFGVKVHDHIAVIVPFMIQYFDIAPLFPETKRLSMFSILSGVGARFYLTSKAFESGAYLQPDFKIGYTNFLRLQQSGLTINPAVKAGYQWVWDSGFTLNLGGGVQYAHVFTEKPVSLGLGGFMLALDFGLGYSW